MLKNATSPPVTSPLPRPVRQIRVGEGTLLINALFFIAGGLCPVHVTVVGQLLIGEILLALIVIACAVSGRGKFLASNPMFRRFAMLLATLLGALVLSDLYNNTVWNDCLRGWSRVLILLLDVAALCLSACERPDRRTLWWFMLGNGIGGVVVAAVENPDVLADWKLGAGTPATIIALCLLTFVNRWTARVAILFVLAAIHTYLDFRSMAGFLVGIAAIEFIHEHRNLDRRTMLIPGLVIVAALALMLGYGMRQADRETDDRREESNTARLIQLKVATEAIADAPILGYGSWAESRAYADQFMREMSAYLGRPPHHDALTETLIPAHSQILQAWVEAGVVSLLFFGYYGYRLVMAISSICRRVTFGSDTPVIALFLVMSCWHLLFSPFSGPHRIEIAISITIITLVYEAESSVVLPSKGKALVVLRKIFGRRAEAGTTLPNAPRQNVACVPATAGASLQG